MHSKYSVINIKDILNKGSEAKDDLMHFYVDENGFKKFDTKIGKENVELVQLLKIL